MSEIKTLARWIKSSTYTVVLTGAGMSTESGVPDFRSVGGWWRNINPQTVANIRAFQENYPLFREFYTMRLEKLQDCDPHEGHEVLAKLEEAGLCHFIATQNVDGFHQQAGSQNVAELHGNIHRIRCQNCSRAYEEAEFIDGIDCSCGGQLRPGVVLFGEYLPEEAWQQALAAIEKADLVIVIGTSLQVSPVNQLPALTRGKKVYINFDIDGFSNSFDCIIQGSARDTLMALAQEIFTESKEN